MIDGVMEMIDEAMLMMDLEGKFWTSQSDMLEELEGMGYPVVEANDEYVVVQDARFPDLPEYVLYIGSTGRTFWIEKVRGDLF